MDKTAGLSNEILGGVFLWRLKDRERWIYRKITEYFEIQDQGRVKKWMKRYRVSSNDYDVNPNK
ncbi:hypothetical protein [Paenibacillus sp. FSL R10-2734]|uniref:hypothetical protein n=1 Tax=Paenibacillus sp. FSL R10-2734 TaxID=2954691 RepID=UPI0030DCBF4A